MRHQIKLKSPAETGVKNGIFKPDSFESCIELTEKKMLHFSGWVKKIKMIPERGKLGGRVLQKYFVIISRDQRHTKSGIGF